MTRRCASLLGLWILCSGGCEPEKPPAPAKGPAAPATAEAGEAGAAVLPADAKDAILTYAGDRGQFKDTGKPAEVPEEARGLVRVTLLQGPQPPDGTVWAANLKTPEADGSWKLSTVPRAQFEELALGLGRSSAVELPPGLEAPVVAPREADVIVYKTEWCGVCKQVQSYLDKKGVKYVAKDIEKDSAAAGELRAKAKEKGVQTGSVPVIDVRGELMVGFNRARLEQLL
ncbi:glutaredoxin family protein [Nannocystis pusilla]|uniref:glutaredoxin family protein n=1 Tax=Nannocystis pusilla TaxID=889268 RepID=UPI003DA3BDF8